MKTLRRIVNGMRYGWERDDGGVIPVITVAWAGALFVTAVLIAAIAGCSAELYCDVNSDCPPSFYCAPDTTVCTPLPDPPDAGTDSAQPPVLPPLGFGPWWTPAPPEMDAGSDAGSDSGSDAEPPGCNPVAPSHLANCPLMPPFTCPGDGAYVCISHESDNWCLSECDPLTPTCCDGTPCQVESTSSLGGICWPW